MVLSIGDTLKLPVRFVGTGEKIEDLEIFDRAGFIEGLLGQN